MNRRCHPVTLMQASAESPTLARLIDLNRESVARLEAIKPLIPVALQSAIRAGPIEGQVWCLLLENGSAAAKIRQLLPALTSHLRVKGWAVDSIRIRIQG